MSVPELPYNISSPEETLQASIRRVIILCSNITKSIVELRSNLTKSQERRQTMFNSMVAHLQMQPQAVPVSYLSLSKVTSQKIFVSSDMAPDIDPVQGIA